MGIRRIAAVGVALIGGLAWAAVHSGLAAPGDDSPAHLDSTYRTLSVVCVVKPLCPISGDALAAMKGALAGKSGDEYGLALMLLTGDGLPSDRAAGMAWMGRAAELGEPAAARDVADRLRNGESVAADERKIAAALQTRVDAGDAEAMRTLGPMIIRGRGLKQDPPAGLALMQRAASLGSSGAERDIARLYLLGAPGVAADYGQFRNWLAASARHGDVDAMTSLGYAFLNGPANGTSRDRDVLQGYCWLVRAALLDAPQSPQAQEKLSLMFADGETDGNGGTIAVDLVQADSWFRLAARSPYHDNSQIRGAIEPKMTSDQIDAAQRQVDAWRPRRFDELKTLPIALPARPGAQAGLCPAME